jgi:hypothetical protein
MPFASHPRLTTAKSYLFTVALTGLRLWLALQWIKSGTAKITNPAWTDGTGRGLLSFWNTALAPTAHGSSAITYDFVTRDHAGVLGFDGLVGWLRNRPFDASATLRGEPAVEHASFADAQALA